ncbi:MAG TPA: hypothetical protein VFY05_08875 [Candidatus Angelobacter sp.]|nr:hypothetical protein [Candidatus Angelobacter sp.]
MFFPREVGCREMGCCLLLSNLPSKSPHHIQESACLTQGAGQVLYMKIILILFFLCVLTVAPFLPVPVVVILCAAAASGLGAALWVAANRRTAGIVIEADANTELGQKSRRKSDRLC